jgi:hypothetical protein
VCGRQQAVGPPCRRATGHHAQAGAVRNDGHLGPVVDAARREAPVGRACALRQARTAGLAALERGQREPLLATAVRGEDEFASDAELPELSDQLLPVGERIRLGDGRVVAAADRVDRRRDDNRGERSDRERLEPPYEAASTGASACSCSPKRARRTNLPIPGEATTSPSFTSTFPRRSTVSTSPTTSVPS